jgi:hypothetical protein
MDKDKISYENKKDLDLVVPTVNTTTHHPWSIQGLSWSPAPAGQHEILLVVVGTLTLYLPSLVPNITHHLFTPLGSGWNCLECVVAWTSIHKAKGMGSATTGVPCLNQTNNN